MESSFQSNGRTQSCSCEDTAASVLGVEREGEAGKTRAGDYRLPVRIGRLLKVQPQARQR